MKSINSKIVFNSQNYSYFKNKNIYILRTSNSIVKLTAFHALYNLYTIEIKAINE